MEKLFAAEQKAVEALYEAKPEHWKRRFKLVIINKVMRFNTSGLTCHRRTTDGCRVRLNILGSSRNQAGEKSFYREDEFYYTRYTGSGIQHEWWGDHSPFADVEEEVIAAKKNMSKKLVDMDTVLKTRVDAGAMQYSLWLAWQATGGDEYPMGSEWNEFGPEEQGCMNVQVVGGKARFPGCQFHTVYSVLRKLRKENASPEVVAKSVFAYCLFAKKPVDQELPKDGRWSDDDIHNFWLKVNKRTIFNIKKRGMPPKEAASKAFGFIMHKHKIPEIVEILRLWENIQIPDDIRELIQRDCFLALRRAGIPVKGSVMTPGPNTLRVYRELSHSLMASCPHTINPEEGHFGSPVLRFLAVDQNLRERTSALEDFSDDKSQVMTIDGLIPGALFNSFSLSVRQWLLGCEGKECLKDCIQKRLFNVKLDIDGRRMLSLGMESLLRDHDAAMLVDTAASLEGTKKGRKAISGLEEDLWLTARNIVDEGMRNRSKQSRRGKGPDQMEELDGTEALNLGTGNLTGMSMDTSLICEAVVDDLMVLHLRDMFTIGVVPVVDDDGKISHKKVYGPHQVKRFHGKIVEIGIFHNAPTGPVWDIRKVSGRHLKHIMRRAKQEARYNAKLQAKYPYEARPAPQVGAKLLPWEERKPILEAIDAMMAIQHADHAQHMKEHKEYMREKTHGQEEDNRLTIGFNGSGPDRTLWSTFLRDKDTREHYSHRRVKTYKTVLTVDEFCKAFPTEWSPR